MNNIQNNSPNFGIRYKAPKKWNIDLLETVMKSDLVQQIDSKYPKAIVSQKFSRKGDAVTASVHFKLKKGMEHSIVSSPSKYSKYCSYPETYKDVAKKVRRTSLEDMEKSIMDKDAKKEHEKSIIKAAQEANRTPFMKKIRKLFHIDK